MSTWNPMAHLPTHQKPVIVRTSRTDVQFTYSLAMYWRPQPEWKQTHPQCFGDGSGHWRWYEADERILGGLTDLQWAEVPS